MLVDVYCDESRQDLLANKIHIKENDRYVCIGGIWVPNEKRSIIKQQINDIKSKYRISGEFNVVVIFINDKGVGKFVTAYIVDNNDTAEKLRSAPIWEK